MFTKSLWNASAGTTDFPALDSDLSVDVAIIGGGATGLALAAELKDSGLNVAVLEALKIGGGTTAHSTGNLYHTLDKHFDQIVSKYDAHTLTRLLEARAAALQQMLGYISKYKLDCDLRRCNWYKYTNNESLLKTFEKELQLGLESSAGTAEGRPEEVPLSSRKIIVAKNQAQFNPMLYCQGLAKALAGGSISIYENTAVRSITTGEHHELETSKGIIRTRYVVQATHIPKGIKLVHTLLGPYREYGIACRIPEPFPPGIFWAYESETEKYSYRGYEHQGSNYLIVVGKPHKVGQETDTASRIQALEKWARENFTIDEVAYRWGGQHYRPADQLPYIGKESDTSFIATGYSTDGLVYGTLAAMIIADCIKGKTNSFEALVDASRHQPLKAAEKFLKENLNVMAQFRKNLPGVADADEFSEVKPGEGQVIDRKGKKLAVYRAKTGALTVRSAVCTHMACIVNFNNAEQTWDCPCHGSRFKPDGTVLEGPAWEPLDPVK